MASLEERRRYQRLVVPLSVAFRTRLPETGEVQQGSGVLRDISLSGSFFQVAPPASFKPGQIVSLTIAAPLPFLDFEEISHLKARGEVVRLEPPGPANPHYGVALHFLEGPSFTSF
jgi:hypothetical protein